MHKPPFRLAPTRISLAVALLLTQAPVLHAQTVDNDRTVSIAISAQPLGSALNALSAATGIPIAFPPALVAGKNAAAVQGSLTPRAALQQLMNNSGLEAQQVNGTFVIRAAGTTQQSSAPLPQVVVKAAAESEEDLPAAYAGGQVARGSRAGLLGNARIMDTPFNTTSYTATLMENQQAITVADVLANDPSVRTVSYGLTNSAAGGEVFMIRGLSVQDSILFDGVPGIMSGRAGSAEIAERVELLKGPNALLNGMAPGAGGAVGGAINIVPKRADDEPLTRMTTTYMSNSNLAAHLDLGRRFGEDKQWGIRFNGSYRNGNTATAEQSVELGVATLGLDYRGSQLRASLDVGHQTMNNDAPQGSAGFGIGDGVAVPSPPSATARIAQSWENTRSRSNFVLAKAEYDLSPQWMIYGAVGGSDTQSRYLSTDITVNDSQGNGTANVYFWPNWTRNQVVQGGLRGTVFTGSVKHRLNLSATYLKSDSGYSADYYGFTSYDTNIYQPVTVAAPSLEGFSSNPPKTNSLQLPSLALSDTRHRRCRPEYLVGRRHHAHPQRYAQGLGQRSGRQRQRHLCPALHPGHDRACHQLQRRNAVGRHRQQRQRPDHPHCRPNHHRHAQQRPRRQRCRARLARRWRHLARSQHHGQRYHPDLVGGAPQCRRQYPDTAGGRPGWQLQHRRHPQLCPRHHRTCQACRPDPGQWQRQRPVQP